MKFAAEYVKSFSFYSGDTYVVTLNSASRSIRISRFSGNGYHEAIRLPSQGDKGIVDAPPSSIVIAPFTDFTKYGLFGVVDILLYRYIIYSRLSNKDKVGSLPPGRVESALFPLFFPCARTKIPSSW